MPKPLVHFAQIRSLEEKFTLQLSVNYFVAPQTNFHTKSDENQFSLLLRKCFIIFTPGCIIEKNTDYRANDIGAMMTRVENQKACAKRSFSRDGALYWTYQPSTKRCWSKTSKAGRMAMVGVVTGSNECGKEG